MHHAAVTPDTDNHSVKSKSDRSALNAKPLSVSHMDRPTHFRPGRAKSRAMQMQITSSARHVLDNVLTRELLELAETDKSKPDKKQGREKAIEQDERIQAVKETWI